MPNPDDLDIPFATDPVAYILASLVGLALGSVAS